MRKGVVVIGSSNMDITARVKKLPRPGETIGGGHLLTANGGKGANQAVAAARMGADVLLLTCLGRDASGETLSHSLAAEGIDTSKIKFSSTPTGTALIFVDDNAENCIAVAPGSNMDLMPEDIDTISANLKEAAYMLIQMEIPSQTVMRAAQMADSLGARVILNPAPMGPVSKELISHLWLITPNETEAEKLTGITIESENDARLAAEALFAEGVENVIITMGSNGSLVATRERMEFVPARPVKALDTTGAGDCYNGALVAALSEGKDLFQAARVATLASSIAVTRLGAQASAPYKNEIESL